MIQNKVAKIQQRAAIVVVCVFGAVLFLSFFVPQSVEAQGWFQAAGCSGPDCQLCNLVNVGNEIIKWLIGVLFVVFAVIMVVAGFKLVMSGGNPAAKQAAKNHFINAIVGFIIVLAAWIIIDTLMRALLDGGAGETDRGSVTGFLYWSEVQCLDVRSPGGGPTMIGLDAPGEPFDDGALPSVSEIAGVPPSPAGQICYHTGVCVNSYTFTDNTCQTPAGNGPRTFFKYNESSGARISNFFTVSQLTTQRAACVVGGEPYAYLDPGAVRGVDEVQTFLQARGKRIAYSTSGYRSAAYNSTLKGAAQNSQHMYGRAFDLIPAAGTTKADIEAACKSVGAGFAYQGSSFTHCDWR